jgi:hypothetical protein
MSHEVRIFLEENNLWKICSKVHFIYMFKLGYVLQIRTEITFTSQILLRVTNEK